MESTDDNGKTKRQLKALAQQKELIEKIRRQALKNKAELEEKEKLSMESEDLDEFTSWLQDDFNPAKKFKDGLKTVAKVVDLSYNTRKQIGNNNNGVGGNSRASIDVCQKGSAANSKGPVVASCQKTNVNQSSSSSAIKGSEEISNEIIDDGVRNKLLSNWNGSTWDFSIVQSTTFSAPFCISHDEIRQWESDKKKWPWGNRKKFDPIAISTLGQSRCNHFTTIPTCCSCSENWEARICPKCFLVFCNPECFEASSKHLTDESSKTVAAVYSRIDKSTNGTETKLDNFHGSFPPPPVMSRGGRGSFVPGVSRPQWSNARGRGRWRGGFFRSQFFSPQPQQGVLPMDQSQKAAVLQPTQPSNNIQASQTKPSTIDGLELLKCQSETDDISTWDKSVSSSPSKEAAEGQKLPMKQISESSSHEPSFRIERYDHSPRRIGWDNRSCSSNKFRESLTCQSGYSSAPRISNEIQLQKISNENDDEIMSSVTFRSQKSDIIRDRRVAPQRKVKIYADEDMKLMKGIQQDRNSNLSLTSGDFYSQDKKYTTLNVHPTPTKPPSYGQELREWGLDECEIKKLSNEDGIRKKRYYASKTGKWPKVIEELWPENDQQEGDNLEEETTRTFLKPDNLEKISKSAFDFGNYNNRKQIFSEPLDVNKLDDSSRKKLDNSISNSVVNDEFCKCESVVTQGEISEKEDLHKKIIKSEIKAKGNKFIEMRPEILLLVIIAVIQIVIAVMLYFIFVA